MILGALNQTLTEGASGPSVAALQKALKSLGYDPGAEGTYTVNTTAAVAEFQAAKGLALTGVADPDTLAALAQTIQPDPQIGAKVREVTAAKAIQAAQLPPPAQAPAAVEPLGQPQATQVVVTPWYKQSWFVLTALGLGLVAVAHAIGAGPSSFGDYEDVTPLGADDDEEDEKPKGKVVKGRVIAG